MFRGVGPQIGLGHALGLLVDARLRGHDDEIREDVMLNNYTFFTLTVTTP
jgi:hypothetical protein